MTQGSPKRAATVAVATPCWPAPVSAMMRVLPMLPREQHLADAVVDLVRPGVVEVFALEIDFRAAEMTRQPLGEIERTGAADIMRKQCVQFGFECRIILRRNPGLFQIQQQRHQRLGHIASAERAEMPRWIRAGAKAVRRRLSCRGLPLPPAR